MTTPDHSASNGFKNPLRTGSSNMNFRAAGALLAIGTAVANSAGLIAPYLMGSVMESAATPLDGFNTGFFMRGVIMPVGGAIAMTVVNPERELDGVQCGCLYAKFKFEDNIHDRSQHVTRWCAASTCHVSFNVRTSVRFRGAVSTCRIVEWL